MLSLSVTHFQLDAIPTVGYADPILSYFSALQFYFDGIRMFKEGYEKAITLSFISTLPRIDEHPTFRLNQVYSKSQIFGDGWCSLLDPSLSTTSRGSQMMSCVCVH